MTKKSMSLGRRIYKIVLSASIIFSGICLILGCAFIYFSGEGYSRNIVANAFSKIDIPIYFCLTLIIVDIIWEIISPTIAKKKFFGKKSKNFTQKTIDEKKANIIKFTILGIALAAAIVGFLLGGYADVLTKAINICTECIGLG